MELPLDILGRIAAAADIRKMMFVCTAWSLAALADPAVAYFRSRSDRGNIQLLTIDIVTRHDLKISALEFAAAGMTELAKIAAGNGATVANPTRLMHRALDHDNYALAAIAVVECERYCLVDYFELYYIYSVSHKTTADYLQNAMKWARERCLM